MTKNEFAMTFCENVECEGCPCHLEDFDIRTEVEKKVFQEPCFVNLVEWIKRKWEIS